MKNAMKKSTNKKHLDINTLASQHLAAIDADWAALITTVGDCAHQSKPEREPYEALVRTVAYQQIHARAAEAILGRLLALHPEKLWPTPDILLSLDDTTLRACGFSARKTATLKAIAAGALSGLVPSRAQAEQMPEDELIARLTQLPGIGRWTVEMLLIYTLERMDILPVDDFGVREGYRLLKKLDQQPTRKAMYEIGLLCSPYRTIAAWYLWRASELLNAKKNK
jgi:DNA-3-methyladenine glycosylase II